MRDDTSCMDCQCSNCEYSTDENMCGTCIECKDNNNQLWDCSCGTHVPRQQTN